MSYEAFLDHTDSHVRDIFPPVCGNLSCIIISLQIPFIRRLPCKGVYVNNVLFNSLFMQRAILFLFL